MLGLKTEGHSFLRLNLQDDNVGRNIFQPCRVEYGMRHVFEENSDLRILLSKTLTGSQIEGDAAPSPIVYKESGRDESLGFGLRVYAGLISIADYLLPVYCPGPYWPRTIELSNWSRLNGRIERKSLTFSSRTRSASNEAGGSIATKASICNTWLWNISRKAPALS